MLPHEDNVLNKFRIWKERHIQMRENRSSHLVGWKTHPTIVPRSGFELTTSRSPWRRHDQRVLSANHSATAAVWMSKNRCCQGHRNRSAVSVTRITVDIGHPSREEEEVNQHRFRSQICRKTSVFTKLHGHKTIEVEFRIRVERPLLPRCR